MTVKGELSELSKILKSGENYYFVKCISAFDKLPIGHKYGLLSYISKEESAIEFWKQMVEDDTKYYDLMRSVLFYFSGREEFSEPCKNDLIKHIIKYAQSSSFKEVKITEEAEDFMDDMRDL